MSRWAWLLPGIRLKRWFLLFSVGLFVFATGWAMFLDRSLLLALDDLLRRAWFALTGEFLAPRWAGLVLAAAGVTMVVAALREGYRTIVNALAPARRGTFTDLVVHRRQVDRRPRVVAVGGGTGLATLVRGLKQYTSNITAVVTVTDDGGSSGRLVGELGILPPGDIRNVLVALADTEPLMKRLLQHRFRRGSLAGHSFGNLLLGALTEVLGDFEQAVHESSQVLAVRGRVLPSTRTPVRLCAELAGGRRVSGETRIAAAGERIERVYLDPADVAPVPEALEALRQADLIVLGPGSLYTSVLPNLLIADLVDGIRASSAVKAYVVNVMTQPGETDGFSAADHVRALLAHTGPGIVDYALVNVGVPPRARLSAYRAQGARPVRADFDALRALGVTPVAADLVARGDLVRHDPAHLAEALLRLTLRRGRERRLPVLDDFLLRRRLGRRAGVG